ncbi:hypothetical protein ACVIWU_006592 [Bradyrhizobium sp. USDA 4509]
MQKAQQMQKNDVKKRRMVKGKIEEIIYAQLKPGEDLLPALWEICKENDVKTGILLDATGSLDRVLIQREPHEPRPGTGSYGIDFAVIDGPLQVSAHGIIGWGWVPDDSVTPEPVTTRLGNRGFSWGGWEGHDTPYLHVHITVTSSSQTACGHLMLGSPVSQSNLDGTSNFTVAIAKVSGVILKATWDKTGYYHDLRAA